MRKNEIRLVPPPLKMTNFTFQPHWNTLKFKNQAILVGGAISENIKKAEANLLLCIHILFFQFCILNFFSNFALMLLSYRGTDLVLQPCL